jgi:hypothetical protein
MGKRGEPRWEAAGGDAGHAVDQQAPAQLRAIRQLGRDRVATKARYPFTSRLLVSDLSVSRCLDVSGCLGVSMSVQRTRVLCTGICNHVLRSVADWTGRRDDPL